MSEETPKTTELEVTAPAPLQLSEQGIETVKRNIALCEQLVHDVLEQEIDYGIIPGVSQPFLWDSGAAKIMAAFNCYADYVIIESMIHTPHIRCTIASHLTNRQSGQVIATGIGSASTKEVKHRYRWVKDPEREGISGRGLKQREDGKYRIPNPDTEDLINVITKMAAKRADVDAVRSLPGVAATLQKLFKAPKGQGLKPNWKLFETKLKNLNISHKEVRDILSVNSIKDDWVGVQGRTLEEAYDIIKETLSTQGPEKEAEDVDLWPTTWDESKPAESQQESKQQRLPGG
jgi:hypothetical protein